MNKADAKIIAQSVTMEQLLVMFNNAKQEISNWEAVSDVNKGITKGAAWNILKASFDSMSEITPRFRCLGVTNMIREFGDYLPDDLKIKKDKKTKPKITPHHEKPLFK